MKNIIIILLLTLFLLGCETQECPPCKCPTLTCPDCTLLDESIYIHFINVGQGDATLIKYKDTEMLIDCGKATIGYKVVEYLKDLKIDELEYLLITHPDEDHMGGCYDILNDINTKRVITNGEERTNVFFKDVISLIDTEQLTTTFEGETISLGPAVMKVIQANTDSEDFNQNSIVTKLVLKETSVLFTGDCDKECEDTLLTKDIESDIFKVPHHGSKFGTSISFLEKVKPEVAVIHVGINNNYGHPTDSVLDRLSQEGVLVYRTDRDGNIVVTITEEGYNIK